MVLAGKALFGNEGVVVEPVDQLLAVGGNHLGLGVVHVAVDEAGHDDAVGVGLDGDITQCGQDLAGGAGLNDLAVFHDDDGVGFIHHAFGHVVKERVLLERQHGSANGSLGTHL